ncbi:MAG: DUF1353 domain-containing protein [Patescibacteria group bacterium]
MTMNSGLYPELLAEIALPYAPGVGITGKMQTVILPDGVTALLTKEFVFTWEGQEYRIPVAFASDFASIPKYLRWALKQRGDYSPAAFIHDYLYWSGIMSRADADRCFLDICERLDVSFAKRQALYWGVRLFAGGVWNNYRKDQMRREGGGDRPLYH